MAATFDLGRLLEEHLSRRPPVTLALRTSGDKKNVGFDFSSGLVTDMRHALGRDPGSYQFTGAYCMEPEIFRRIPSGEAVSIIPLFLDYIREGRLRGILADDGLWMDMGTPEAYLQAHLDFPSTHPLPGQSVPPRLCGRPLRDRPRSCGRGRLPPARLRCLAGRMRAFRHLRGTPDFLLFPHRLLTMLFLRLLPLILCFSGLVHAEHRVFTRKDGFLSMRDKLNVYFFRSDTHRLLVRDEGSVKTPRYGSLDKAMRKSPCVAGVNGGFFSADAEGTPLGLVVQDGKRLSPLATGSFAVSGVVYEGGRDGLTLIRSSVLRRMRRLPAMQAAIQGGPFLVENGSAVKGLNAQKSTYRTFIATDGGRRWCIGVSSSLTLKELAAWLAAPGALGNFRVETALNLDGGSSSAFWCHETGISYPAFKQVRNYLGVAPVERR